jgi:SAM-dependent methyltransferase
MYMTERSFEDRYRNGDTPWDHGMVDHNLADVLGECAIQACRALDIGCGTGGNAIWLARQGFDVVACDLSPTAIKRAQSRQGRTGTHVSFVVADFLTDPLPDGPYGLLFDRGCLHSISGEAQRRAFIQKAASMLDAQGYWLSLICNADEGERETGPPQLTAAEVVTLVEPSFEIISLSTGFFGSDQDDPPRAWICLLRKREQGRRNA